MKEGELWGYGTSDTPFWFVPVRVHKVEDKYVVGSYLDDDGVEYPRKRILRRNLRVLWDDRWEFLQAARIRKADLNAEDDAATFVFEELIPDEIASLEYGTTRMTIEDPEALSLLTGIPADKLASTSMDCYQIARAAMAARPDAALRKLGHEERATRLETVLRAQNSDAWSYYSDERRMETLVLEAGRLTERRNSVLRAWAGEDAVNVMAENTILRLELLAARMAAAEAVEALEKEVRTVRGKRLAAELRRRLSEGPASGTLV